MPYAFQFAVDRQCFIPGVSPAEADRIFGVLVHYFSAAWLKGNNGNAIQMLWQREDNLATIELYGLGKAIDKLVPTAPEFIADKVELMKSNKRNDVMGAAFEVIALSFFAPAYVVIPAPSHQPGYDGTVTINDKSIRLSVKNFSTSSHNDAFHKNAEDIENLIKDYVVQFDMPPLEVVINKREGYPYTSNDWQELYKNLHGVFIEYLKRGKHAFHCQIGGWSCIMQGLRSSEGYFSLLKKSYTLILSSPYHKNEEKNLLDKLDEACYNLSQHEKVESDNIKNMIIVHLPQIAERDVCENWAKDYLVNFPDKPISGIILYQPLVVQNNNVHSNSILNGINIVLRDDFKHSFATALPLTLTFPVGALHAAPVGRRLLIQETATTALEIAFKNMYVYQAGHHYLSSTKQRNSIQGVVGKVASGIFTHAIIEMGNTGVDLTPVLPNSDDLLIL